MQLGRIVVALKPVLIHSIGIEGLLFIDDNFRKQGYQGRSFIPWKIQNKPNKPRPHKILVLDTILQNSFKGTEGSDAVEIGTDNPYAQVHNQGFKGSVYVRSPRGTFGKPFIRNQNIPQRQFIPITRDDSPVLVEKCERVIIRKIIAALPK